ncbi:hypothetical protein [Undibacterium sp. Ji22W]|uniref:hypothetical protein n=1 Tax=Undibacterium sp. Ji22W TaxID=3413038 RepID=UPI003BF0DA82
MPLFQCLIRGDNFPGKIIHQRYLIGFYTTRFVKADTSTQAEELAIQLLQNDVIFSIPIEERSHTAKVYFEEIIEVVDDVNNKPNQGYTFFPMDDETSEIN